MIQTIIVDGPLRRGQLIVVNNGQPTARYPTLEKLVDQRHKRSPCAMSLDAPSQRLVAASFKNTLSNYYCSALMVRRTVNYGEMAFMNGNRPKRLARLAMRAR